MDNKQPKNKKKRTLLITLITVAICIICAVGIILAVCLNGNDSGTGQGSNTEQGGNDNDNNDNNDNNDDNDDNNDNNDNNEHQHILTLVEEKKATCTANGNTPYYICNGCKKWFSDGEGTIEITDKSSVIIAKGHKLTPVDEKKATCTENGNTAYFICGSCGKWFSDGEGTTEITDKSSVVIAKGHKLTPVEEKKPTCIAEGNSEYFICSGCGKWFSDEEGTTEIADKSSVILEKSEHKYQGNTCSVCGAVKPTEGLAYRVKDDGYEVSGIGTATDRNVVIASSYNGKPVISVGNSAFYNYTALTGITIPDTVKYIDNFAFNGCINLNTISIQEGIVSIGNKAFYGCSKLKSISIPESLTSIGQSAFFNCNSLTEVHIKDVAKWCAIPFNDDQTSNPLYYAHNLYLNGEIVKNLIIPDGVTTVSSFAFCGCTSITSVSVPDSIITIGRGAFSSCTNLKYNEYDNALYLGNDNNQYLVLIQAKSTSVTSCNINEKTKVINHSAFFSCSSLNGITIPSGVTIINDDAFYSCGFLSKATIPESVTTIGKQAFFGCSRLKNISIPESVDNIGEGAFSNCSSLTAVTVSEKNENYLVKSNCLIDTKNKTLIVGLQNGIIPDDGSVTSIGSFAFYGCSWLTEINIPDTITFIGESAFSRSNLTEVVIPESVTSIGTYAFNYCISLRNITIPDNVTDISNNAFNGCTIVNATIPATACKYVNNSKLKNVTITSGTNIPSDAFKSCTELTQITIPDTVTSIDSNTFQYCRSLSEITIPASITSIGNFAFQQCTSLKTINFKGTEKQWTALSKGYNWDANTPNYTIHCIDADIAKS